MNRKQTLALGTGLVVAILLGLLYPWTGRVYSLSPPNFEPLISWGIFDIRIGVNPLPPALLLVSIATIVSVLLLRIKKLAIRVVMRIRRFLAHEINTLRNYHVAHDVVTGAIHRSNDLSLKERTRNDRGLIDDETNPTPYRQRRHLSA